MRAKHRGRAGARGGTGQGKLTARLRWELRNSGDEDAKKLSRAVAKWRAKRGRDPAPDDIEPDPIFPDLLPIWTAWHTLSMARPSGMEPSGIPWSEMSCYCDDHEIVGPWKLRFIRLLVSMEAEFFRMRLDHKKAKEAAKRGSPRSRD